MAGTTEGSMELKLGLNTKEYEEKLEKVKEKTEEFGDKIKEIAMSFAVGFGLEKAFDLFLEQTKAVASFENAMHNVVGATDEETEALKEFAEQAEEAFGVDADTVMGAEAFLAKLTGSAEVVEKLKMAMMDMAASTGQSMDSVAQILARVMANGPSSLSRYGIQVTDEMKAQGDAFGDDMEAKAEGINGLIEGKFKGSAEAAGNSVAGQFEKAKLSIINIMKAIGAAIAPIVEVVGKLATIVAKVLIPPIQALASLFKLITSNIPLLIATLTALGIAFLVLKGQAIAAAIASMWAGIMTLFATNPFAAVAIAAATLAALAGLGYGIASAIGGSSGGSVETPETPKPSDKDKDKKLNIEITQNEFGEGTARQSQRNGVSSNVNYEE